MEARRRGAGGIEQRAVREPGAPAGGELPVLALDVMDDSRPGAGQERGEDEAHALAGPGRRRREHVLGTVVMQVAAAVEAEDDAFVAEKTGLTDIGKVRPAE